MPWIIRATKNHCHSRIAGIPRRQKGMNEETEAALFAASGAATPSIALCRIAPDAWKSSFQLHRR